MSKMTTEKHGKKTFFKDVARERQLDAGVYRYIPASMQAPAHLEDFSDFSVPSKIYGRPLEYMTDKVLKTFKHKKTSIGLLLSGLKGTGKSLQLKHLALNSNMPCVIFDTFVDTPDLISFLEDVPSSCVVLFDEFEKLYRNEKQEKLLPVLEGVCTTPHIFVLTVNGEVSKFLTGRPGRIRYKVEYERLSDDVVKEIIEDLCENEDQKDDLYTLASMLDGLNMDMLVSLVEETNLYKEESLTDIIKVFNLDNPLDSSFDIVLYADGLYIKGLSGSDELSENLKKIKKFLMENKINDLISPLSVIPGSLQEASSAALDLIVENFPEETKKSKVYGEIRSVRLGNLDKDTEFYIQTYFGAAKPSGYHAYSGLENNYLYLSNKLSYKKEGKSINIYCGNVLVGHAEKSFAPSRKNLF